MKLRKSIDKNIIFLVVIIIITLVTFVVVIAKTIVEPFDEAVKNGSIINIAFILEKNGKPVFTEIFLYYPQNARAALLDIPVETGLIIKRLNRTDRIDALYESKHPEKYLNQIEEILQTNVDYYIVMDVNQFIHFVDLLEGCSVFIPEAVSYELDGQQVQLPYGNLTLDGEKMLYFVLHKDMSRPDWEYVGRCQDTIKALIKNIGVANESLKITSVKRAVIKNIKTNLPERSLFAMFASFAQIDTDKIIYQRLTGINRVVDNKDMIFPLYDGELVRDIVKQTLNALSNAESFVVEDKIFTMTILNGTPVRGLAKKASEVYSSFGYEVMNVSNFESTEEAKTRIIAKTQYQNAAENVARVIKCDMILYDDALIASSNTDFIIILGKDFNGRYCVK